MAVCSLLKLSSQRRRTGGLHSKACQLARVAAARYRELGSGSFLLHEANPNTPLADRLRKIFERGEITEVHRFLATPALHPMVIVTLLDRVEFQA